MKKSLLLLLPFLVGCASTPQGPTQEDKYKAIVAEVNATAAQRHIDAGAPLVVDEVCPNGRKGCDKEALHARWRERYFYANWPSFIEYCKGHKAECKDERKNELGLRQNHNQGNQAAHFAALEELAQQHRQITAANQERLRQHAQNQNALYHQMQPAAVAPVQKQTDQACVSRCISSGSLLQFCQAKCTY